MSKYIYTALGTLCGIFLIATIVLYSKLQTCNVKRQEAITSLEFQNEAIKQQALDSKNYTKNAPKVQEKIVYRYKEIKSDTSSCEVELNNLKNIIDIFYTRAE